MKKIRLFLLFMIVGLFAFTSCDALNGLLGNNSTTPNVEPTESNPTNENNKTENGSQESDQRYQIYLSAKESGYNGSYEEWLASISGDEIELSVQVTYLVWKYKSETQWKQLFDINLLKGSKTV